MKNIYTKISKLLLITVFLIGFGQVGMGQWTTVTTDNFDNFSTGFAQTGFSKQGYGAEVGGSSDNCAYDKNVGSSPSSYVSKQITLESGYIYRFSYMAKRAKSASCGVTLRYASSTGNGGTNVSSEFTPPKRTGSEAGDNYISNEITGDGNSYYLKASVTTGNSSDVKLRIDGFLVERKAASSNDNDSEANAPTGGQQSGGTISSLDDTNGEAVNVFKFDIEDKGTADGLPTHVTNIHIVPAASNTADWTDHIQGLTLNNGSAITIGAPTITDTYIDIPITSGNLDITDGNLTTITMAIYLNTSNIVDGDVLSFMIDADANGFTADAAGSTFAGTFTADVVSNDFTVAVIATELNFVQEPTGTEVNAAMSPNPTVKACDANGNIDTDYSTAISVSSDGTMTGDPVAGAWSSGVATFANLTHTVIEATRTLTATSGTLTDGTSINFDITAVSNSCGSETFTNSNATSSYSNGNYVGDNGVTWNYVASRDAGSYQITGAGLMLRRSSDNSKVYSSSEPGGIASFTCSLKKAFTGSGNRQVELFVNGVSQGTSIAWDNTSVQTFTVNNIDISGNVVVEIRNITSKQVVVDDISWECYACSEPTNDAANITFPTINSTSLDLSWDSGNGDNRIVICRKGAAVSFTPTDNTTYTANSDYSAGTEVGTAGELNKVVYNGNGNTVTVTGLEPGTTYYFEIFEYSCSAGAEDYLTSGTPAEGNETTLPENVSGFTLTCITNTTATLTWNLPTGGFDGIMIAVRESTNPPSDPSCDGATLSAPDTDFSTATTYCGNSTNSRYVYNATGTTVSITGLTPGADYVFKAFTYNGSDWTSGTQTSSVAQISDVSSQSTLISNKQIRVSWVNPATCYDEIMVVAHENGSVSSAPEGDGTAYTANAVFGSGTNMGSNDYVVYKGTGTFEDVTGLNNGTNYCFKIFVRKGSEWSAGVEVCDTPADITVFKPGDLIFVGYDTKVGDCASFATATDVYYILTMTDIKPGTTFGLLNASYEYGAAAYERTDKFWGCTSTPGQYAPGRISVQWNGSGNIAAGSVIELFVDPTAALDSAAVNGTDQKANFSSSGDHCNIAETNPDQIWIYQGTILDYGTTPNIYSKLNGNILFGLSNQADWVPVSDPVSTVRTSRIHPDIDCFNMAFSGDIPVNYYQTSATHTGSKRSLLGNIMTSGNWSQVSNTTCNDVPTGVSTATFTINPGYSAGTWRGDADDNWFNCSNWEELTVPDADVDVDINNTATITNSPKIDHAVVDAAKFNYIAKCNNLVIDNETLTIQGSSLDTLFVNGDLTLQNSGTLDMNSGGANDGLVYLSGNWNNQAVFNAGKGTVVFNGADAQTITTSSATEAFNNLRLTNNNLAGVTIEKNIVINDTLSQTNNLLNLNGQNIQIAGVYENTNSYFEGDAASDFVISSDVDNGYIDSIYFKNDMNINNFTIDRAGKSAVLMTNLSVNNNLTITAGNVTLTAGHDYDVAGTLTNTPGTPDALILKSDASGTASLIQQTGAVPATVERYLSGDNWHFIFAPLNQIDTSVFTVTSWNAVNPNVYWYNEPTADFWQGQTIYNPTGWTNVNGAYLKTDRGYINYFTADKIYTQTGGNLNDADKSFTLSYTDNGSGTEPNTGTDWDNFEGWNLLGNPYVSAVDWDNAGLNKDSIENFVYYYDDSQDKYLCYGGNPPWDNNGVSINGGTQYVPAGQAFMVKSVSGGNGQPFSIPKTARTHTTHSFYKASTKNIENVLKLQIKKGIYSDETLIRTFPAEYGMTDGHDKNYDAYKMFSYDESAPQIYSHTEDNSNFFAVNTLSEINSEKVIPLGIYVGEAGTHSIEMIENYFTGMHIWLEDRAESINTDLLKQNLYTFNQTAETNDNRFFLHIQKNTKPVVNADIPDQITDVNILYEYTIPENIFIDNDFEDELRISAELENGNALPGWLNFNAETGVFSGIPAEVQSLNIKVTATDMFGQSVSDIYKLTVNSVSSINDISDKSIHIYPNPTKDVINIEFLANISQGEIILKDITGKIIHSEKISSGSNKLYMSNLSKGVYMLEIRMANQSINKKIIKE